MEPKHESGYRVAIVNPLTLVGTEIKTILQERSFPLEKVILLDTSGETAGALTEVSDEPAVVAPASDVELEDCDVVFFCGPPAANHAWLEHAGPDKFVGIDVSQPSTRENGTLAVAGVNLHEASDSSLFVSPHHVTSPMALTLQQIEQISPIELCTATVVQPASEFERAGVEELAAQTVSVLNIKSVSKTVFDRQLAFNLYPALEHNEEFIVAQLRQLIDPRTAIALFITQGTIFHGHTFSIFIKTRDQVDTDRIAEALRQNPAIGFAEGDQSFGTIDAAGRDDVLIAEIRPDPSIKGAFWLWAACDNIRRGAALNAVLIAEEVAFGRSAAN